jgi:hypothetical protein
VIHVSVGTDTYGRVKKVGSTPIVTRFGMVSGAPVYPIESLYFIRFGESSSGGIPFLAPVHSTAVVGIPLARLDKLSVTMAYIRGFFGAMAIIGFIFTFVIFMMWMTGERFDGTGPVLAACAGLCFVVGIVAGAGTYVFPFQTTRRERDIRRACGSVLGISVDPARVRQDCAASIDRFLEEVKTAAGVPGLMHEVARTRVRIALGEPAAPLEHRTDDLLESIRIQAEAVR